ncbi:hypothetical protein PE36_00175 [Moritella sp. PE36]|uniref:VRR-NUC domain-containing protein n=1 Tax=Moritella sp. PE36 TaxID=58051 RepID=UPI0001569284|nr:VRR-NUC domain-containing protein [Moritella sp. PE36]EDM66166.1 hypothetical protein PE36_00175 [Moritella sp. PE36]
MSGLETRIQADIINFLIRDDRIAWVHRCNTGKSLVNGRMVEFGLGRGTADIIGMTCNGKFLAIEVKTPTGRISDHQRMWLKRVAMHGGLAAVVRSIDDVKASLNAGCGVVYGL